ncbi:MAG: sodium:proton exchanger [Desulfocurvibacter africanus]
MSGPDSTPRNTGRKPRKVSPLSFTHLSGINMFEPLDAAAWLLVPAFFIVSALITGGNMTMAFMGAAGIVLIMFLVGASIEVLIESIKDIRGLGTMVGFITNGPEALCLLVGLLAGDVLFAASTPLGSNVVNPLMLLAAGLLTGTMAAVSRTRPRYTLLCILCTALTAVSFFLAGLSMWLWLLVAAAVSFGFFFLRPPEPGVEHHGEEALPKVWLIPAGLVVVIAGYFLDPIVTFTAQHSQAPKGLIGFFVLATLTSWPEFKSTLSLLRRRRPLAAILNITVSNITNLWLAMAGVTTHYALGF